VEEQPPPKRPTWLTLSVLGTAGAIGVYVFVIGSEIGTIAPGMTADIVAMRGDYLADATALRQMAFVMKGGRVFKYQP
jgi:imidazolonepropionase-like amidohydrolase